MKTINKFNVALCQMKVIDNKKANLEKAKYMIECAVNKHNSQLIVLPEFFNCPVGLGYSERYAEEESNSESISILSKIARDHKVNLVGGSIPMKENGKFYNTCYCFDRNGDIKAKHQKVHLFDIDIPGKMTYQESAILSAGSKFTVFDSDVAKIGIGICYDIRFGEYAQILKKYYKIDMLIYPAAFNTVTGPMHWDLLQRSRALDNNVFLAICSPSRNPDNAYKCYGYSSIIDPFGKVLTTTEYDEDIISTEIDLDVIHEIEAQIPTWKQKRDDMYEIVKLI